MESDCPAFFPRRASNPDVNGVSENSPLHKGGIRFCISASRQVISLTEELTHLQNPYPTFVPEKVIWHSHHVGISQKSAFRGLDNMQHNLSLESAFLGIPSHRHSQ